ncbi:MAG: radical SAM protein [Armatimonadetes bacterium]|nr:radical SAM protein [Armatimonadota bacterium]
MKKKHKGTLLLFPPCLVADGPPEILAQHAAVFRAHGKRAEIVDLNIEALDALLSSSELSRLSRKVMVGLSSDHSSDEGEWEAFAFGTMASYVAPEMVDGAKKCLRDPKSFYDFPSFTRSYQTLRLASQLAASAYYPTYFGLSHQDCVFGYSHPWTPLDRMKLHAEDPEHNVFLGYFEGKVVPRIQSLNPLLVGIALLHQSQLLCALTLARLLRKHLPGTHVTLFGDGDQLSPSMFLPLLNRAANKKLLTDFFHSMVVHESEGALLELADRLERGESLSGIRNLVFLNGGSVEIGSPFRVENIAEFPVPDYSGLPFDLYLTPKAVLPLTLGRGCYWGKCAFCAIESNQLRYHQKSIPDFVTQIEELSTRHGTTLFWFTDQALHPRVLRRFCDEVSTRGLVIQWSGRVRAEEELTLRLLSDLKKSGCTALHIGLESANPRVSKLMNKGTRKTSMTRILKGCRTVGIDAHLFVLLGFPGEIEEEARDTVAFISEHHETDGKSSAFSPFLTTGEGFRSLDADTLEKLTREMRQAIYGDARGREFLATSTTYSHLYRERYSPDDLEAELKRDGLPDSGSDPEGGLLPVTLDTPLALAEGAVIRRFGRPGGFPLFLALSTSREQGAVICRLSADSFHLAQRMAEGKKPREVALELARSRKVDQEEMDTALLSALQPLLKKGILRR